MLCLTIKQDDSVVIGDNIRVTVQRVNGKQVRLLFDAPRDIHILREKITNQETTSFEVEPEIKRV